MQRKLFSVKLLAMTALMAALVFVGTFLRIKIPVGLDGTMLHLGNVFGLLAGLLFGPLPGGIAAGLGSALFDVCSEYASEALITFANKFCMGFACGLVVRALLPRGGSVGRYACSAAAGALTYCVLYVLKTIIFHLWVYGMPAETLPAIVGVKALVTLVNGCIAVVVSVIFARALQKALRHMDVLPPWQHKGH